jgi:hypothetical protein
VAPEIEIRGTVRGALGDPAAELRLPSIFQWPEKAEAGGLADDDSIKEKASLCTSCHGKGDVSQTENIPSPAGQPDLFVQWQIFFRSGARKSDRRTTQEIRNLGVSLRCSHPRRQSLMKRRRWRRGENRGRTRLCENEFPKRVMRRRHGNKAYSEYGV